MIRLLWCGVVLLVLIGLGVAVGRAAFPTVFITRVEPVRVRMMTVLHRDDPFASQRAEILDRFDSRFAAHPGPTLLHILPGGIFLALAPLQFSARIRRRHIRVHRWSGRLLLLAGCVTAVTALYFGLLMPYGGPGEAAAIALFGGLFLVAVTRAFIAIRRHQVARHREWMIRAFAIAIGISTMRVVGVALEIAFTPAGLPPRALFVLSIWTSWAITLGAAELWIRHTRARIASLAVPA